MSDNALDTMDSGKHSASFETLNSDIEFCIAEHVRLIENRDILRDKWFRGLSLKQLSDKYNKSDTAIKNVVYGIGDKILLAADKRSKRRAREN